MLEIVGFFALVALGLFVGSSGLGLLFFAAVWEGDRKGEAVAGLVITAIAASLLYVAYTHSPFTITFTGS